MNNNKLTVLIFVSNYLPGYKSGGPVRTIANLVEHLGDVYNFLIITKDRDFQDPNSYQNIRVNEWNKIDNSYVYYLSPDALRFSTLKRILKSTKHDILYLNSFFNFRFTILPILANKLFSKHKKQIILAPRGEFSQGALVLKSFKKKLFIYTSSIIGLYKSVIFQASGDFEKNDIVDNLSNKHFLKIIIAPNLPPQPVFKGKKYQKRGKKNTLYRIVFLSRISQMKNLEYALIILSKVKIPVVFDIYGPIQDKSYWNKCQKIIDNLPYNIVVKYLGEVKHELVRETLESYDLFFLPTAGENFGHVILESLSAGTPVLISDTTPWRNLQSLGVGWDISLSNRKEFIEIIEKIYAYNEVDYSQLRKNAITYSKKVINDFNAIEANKNLFNSAYKKELKINQSSNK
ncbi:hypothetical protein ES705_32601 [subsurface metagenome]